MKDKTLDYTKTPRLYCEDTLDQGRDIALDKDTAHYLVNVMRKSIGDHIRIFNEKDGEWLATLTEAKKKSAVVTCYKRLRQGVEQAKKLSLIFAPVKKSETDLIVQKATELGVSDIYPVQSDYTQTNRIRMDRFQSIAKEAAEQCERLDIPNIHEMGTMPKVLEDKIAEGATVYIALERMEGDKSLPFNDDNKKRALVVGPEGGFSDKEKAMFADLIKTHDNVHALHLGETVLRAETAVIAGLAVINYLLN